MFVLEGLIENKSALVQVMAWCYQAITWTDVDQDHSGYICSN